MTREEIYRLARQAGFFIGALYVEESEAIERFVSLVAAAEREAMRQDGWRRCAEGQGETQYCGLLEAAVLAEREACEKVASDYADYQRSFGDEYAELRAMGALEVMDKISARGKE